MKNIPAAMKVVINMIFFVVYSIISMNIANFLFDSVLHFSGKTVPESGDTIHLKIAGAVLIFMLILTIIFRKYFYLSLNKVEVKKTRQSKKKIDEEEQADEKIKIYMDKEIK